MGLIEAGHIDRLTDYTLWAAGQTGTVGEFVQNGVTAENSRVAGVDPWGRNTVLWETSPIDDAGPGGGWSQTAFSIDNTQLYRFSAWVNYTVAGTSGQFYFGFNAYGSVNGAIRFSDSTTQTNCYFWATSNPPVSQLPVGEWRLVVGHVFPHTKSDTVDHPDTGRWELDGTQTTTGGSYNYDWKWLPETTTGRQRCWIYYHSDAAETFRFRFAYPRIDLVDGTEPSINKLLSGNYYESYW